MHSSRKSKDILYEPICLFIQIKDCNQQRFPLLSPSGGAGFRRDIYIYITKKHAQRQNSTPVEPSCQRKKKDEKSRSLQLVEDSVGNYRRNKCNIPGTRGNG